MKKRRGPVLGQGDVRHGGIRRTPCTILKSDGEPSITALKDAVKASRGLNAGVEVSPFGDSQANGDVERASRTARGQVRAMKSALGSNYQTEFGERHALVPWLASYASSVINKFTIDAGGGWNGAREMPRAKVQPPVARVWRTRDVSQNVTQDKWREA